MVLRIQAGGSEKHIHLHHHIPFVLRVVVDVEQLVYLIKIHSSATLHFLSEAGVELLHILFVGFSLVVVIHFFSEPFPSCLSTQWCG